MGKTLLLSLVFLALMAACVGVGCAPTSTPIATATPTTVVATPAPTDTSAPLSPTDTPAPVPTPTTAETPTPPPSADNCVACHTDPGLLQQLAEEKVVRSEMTEGEG